MSRIFNLAECKPIDIIRLQEIADDSSPDSRLKLRAQSILMTINGMNGKEIAKELNVRENSVSNWRRAFNISGINGLYDKENPGRRGKGKPDPQQQVLEMLESNPPDGSVEWTTEALSKAVGTSVDTVRRVLRENYIKLGSSSSWQIEAKLETTSKAVGIAGLYLSSTESAFVLCSSPEPVKYTITGSILTHSKALSDRYTSLTENSGNILLEEAILAALEDSSNGKKSRNTDLMSFLNIVRSSVKKIPDNEMVVLHFIGSEGMDLNPIRKDESIIFDTSESLEQWLWKVCFASALVSKRDANINQTDGLYSAIQKFVSIKDAQSEPFQWIIRTEALPQS